MAAIGSFSPGGSSTTAKSNPYRDPFAAALPKAAPLVGGMPKDSSATIYPTYPTSTAGGGSATTTVANPPAATPTGGSPAPAAPAGSGQSIYDLSKDPIVQKIQALNTANYGQAVATAQSSAKQDLIDSGFSLSDALAANPDIAAAISGSPIGSVLTDQATNLAAAQNPYSTAAGLLNTHTGNNNTIDQNENANNLFYSSDRANQLGQEDTNYLGSVSGAQNSLATALSGLLGGLTTEQQTEQQNLANTIETDRENVIQNAISSGQVMLGYDSNGNPIFGNAPTTSSGADSTGTDTSTPTPTAATIASGATPLTATLLESPAVQALLKGPTAVAGTSNKTGLSANKNQGVISVH